jgi:multidrug efflux pump subunit AcrA (membrane-fusion protein)
MNFLARKFHCGLIVLGLLGMCVGCRDEEPAAAPVRPIRAIRIGDTPALIRRAFPGTAEAVDAVDLSFRVGGPLVAFPANELGKAVNKGDLLAQIDARDFEVRLSDADSAYAKAMSELDAMRKSRPEEIEQLKASLARAEAAAQFARTEYGRYLQLRTTKSASESDIQLAEAKAKLADAEVITAKEALRIGEEGARPEDIKAKESQIASLQATVQKAKDELADTKLTAPFNGSISAAYVENYEVVQPKQRILRLVNTSELEIRIDVPENLIALVPKVKTASVIIQNYPDVQIPARIAEVGTEASLTTRTYPVKLRFTPPEGVDVRPGMTGTVRGEGDPDDVASSPGHVVPASAVFERGGKRFVWIYDTSAKTVGSREVNVLGTTPYGLNITGVEPSEWVVTAGTHYLQEKQTVRLLSEPAEEGAEV